MAHIKLPEFKEMAPELQELARPILEKTGQLGEIFRLIAIDPKIYFATDGMVKAYLLNETELPYDTKESIALLISKENSCTMCVDVHKGIAKMLGVSDKRIGEVLEGIESMHTSDKEKSFLNFCVRASRKDNYKIVKGEVDALKAFGYTELQILEAVAITGYFNYINTLSNVFALGE